MVDHKYYSRDVVVQDEFDETYWTLSVEFRRLTVGEARGVSRDDNSALIDLMETAIRSIRDDRTGEERSFDSLIDIELLALEDVLTGNSQSGS